MEAVGQLAGGIAHDFNNLLLIVGSYADLLSQSFEEDDPRRDDAAEISPGLGPRRCADAPASHLLPPRRRSSPFRSMPPPRSPRLYDDAPTARSPPPIDLRLELEPTERATVIDAGQLEQVVLNVVLNAQERDARRWHGDDPHPRSRDRRRLAVEGLVPGAYVAITVSDTGEGMSEQVRSRALEPFFTTRGDTGGSGLGLATVYGIVTGAGGAITLDSAPGEGTTVVLYLPTTAEPADAPAVERDPCNASERADQTVVLVAEDEPTILALTTRMLALAGIRGATRRIRRRRSQARAQD